VIKLKACLSDVERIRNNSMVPTDIPIYGYIYDCKTGSLVEVIEATEAGKVN
jgi:carbonic anhydrase